MEMEKFFLTHVVRLASEGIDNGSGPFAAAIVKDGKIIAESGNCVVLNSDPTAHAEVMAIRKAASAINSHDLYDCTIYCSCEPCPMCLGAIYWAGIKNVVYACDRNDAAQAGFSDKEIYDEIMLKPSERKIGFIKIDDTGGEEVFRKWEKYDRKIPY
jgi:tRNA(Arg) A34 adenosine deaminase TadA